MSIYRRAARIDANQQSIVNALRKVGAVVWIIRIPADILIFYRGHWQPAEIKDGAKPPSERRLTASQRADHALLPAGAIPIIESVDDALALVARMGGKA